MSFMGIRIKLFLIICFFNKAIKQISKKTKNFSCKCAYKSVKKQFPQPKVKQLS